jgi:hypothetical protein
LWFKASLGKQFARPYLGKPSQKELVEWFKMKTLSSSPSTAINK